jgi:MazG family protein
MSARTAAGDAFDRLVGIMAHLRSPDGCPWDREQTLSTLAPFVLEEAYEVVDAIERNDLEELRGEIGDLIFEGVFLAQLTAERGDFTVADALDEVSEKLVRRHPHVFQRDDPASAGVDTPSVVKTRWDAIKVQERHDAGKPRTSLLDGIPRSLPALLRAFTLGTRAARARFDWPDAGAVVAKVREELAELDGAIARDDAAHAAEEIGDLLFAVANLARKLDVEPEAALRGANEKFARRFEAMRAQLDADGLSLGEATLDEMDAAWNRIKARRP